MRSKLALIRSGCLIVVLDADAVPGRQERKQVLARLAEEMRQNPLPLNSPAFTRADLHERG